VEALLQGLLAALGNGATNNSRSRSTTPRRLPPPK
jgi:hypothetical protein